MTTFNIRKSDFSRNRMGHLLKAEVKIRALGKKNLVELVCFLMLLCSDYCLGYCWTYI